MATKKSSPKRTSKLNEVLVNVVLDRSGSMASCRESTISGFNEYLNGLRSDAKAKYSVSLTQFDAPMDSPELTICYLDKPVSEVPNLSRETYEPRGCTPLYDAIGETVRRVGERANGRPVLNVIITDGLENASKEFNQGSIKALIQSKEAEGWTFVFLGANIDSFAVSANLGVSAKNVSNYDQQNVKSMYANLAMSTCNYTSNRMTTGCLRQLADESFFTDSQRQQMKPGQTVTTGGTGTTPSFRKWADVLANK